MSNTEPTQPPLGRPRSQAPGGRRYPRPTSEEKEYVWMVSRHPISPSAFTKADDVIGFYGDLDAASRCLDQFPEAERPAVTRLPVVPLDDSPPTP